MFVTTFYSFKGGVGRTLALANVAAELSRRGKSVLVADFDLEAPGLSSFSFNGCDPAVNTHPGIVEFIHDWLKTQKSPDIMKYVTKCQSKSGTSGAIWVMPAGRMNDKYGARLHSIDWAELYERQDGYLLLEDMKAQWGEVIQPDYVLIDSRTGHTDVGGICTRQLPDLVTFVFWPNIQNITGLESVLKEIRQSEINMNRRVEKIFVPSNLPTIDDEESVLSKSLQKFRCKLKYNTDREFVIHNYQSYEILEQVIFTVNRPKSILAKEYRNLTEAIMMQNDQDEEGVALFLDVVLEKRFSERFFSGSASSNSAVDQKVESLFGRSWKSAEIHRHLARLKSDDQDVDMAVYEIRKAIELDDSKPSDWSELGRMLEPKAENKVERHDIALRILRNENAGPADINTALRLVSLDELDIPADFHELKALQNLKPGSVSRVLPPLQSSRLGMTLASKIVMNSIELDEDKVIGNYELTSSFVLPLISTGLFEESVELLENVILPSNSKKMSRMIVRFNKAIANWGVDGEPSTDEFLQIIDLHQNFQPSRIGPNYFQCIALCYGVLGDMERFEYNIQQAKDEVRQGLTVFSCWTYLDVRPDVFVEHLGKMQAAIRAGDFQPPFFKNIAKNKKKRKTQPLAF